jgi:BirA family biotin operon repressor/biotin-[acetyl-CoA-carboxylase] ligase
MAQIGNEIIRMKETDSTNRFFIDWLSREKPPEGTVIVVENQTAGRGMDGNAWESAPSQNLTFSFVLYPEFLAPDAQFYLNKAISLGISDTVSEIIKDEEKVRIKWPNDIYTGDHKVSGTLIQNGVKGNLYEYSVIGIGLNVNQETFHGDALNPVSLKMITGKDSNLDELLDKLLDNINRRYEQLKNGAIRELDEDYLSRLYRYKQLSGFIFREKQIQARIIGVNHYGQLVLEIPGEKIIECDLKEIKFL